MEQQNQQPIQQKTETKPSSKTNWKFIAIVGLAAAVLTAISWVAWEIRENDAEYESNRIQGATLLREEPALQVKYPGSVLVHTVEYPAQVVPLQGLSTAPEIDLFYGVNGEDEEVEAFYRQLFADLGWNFAGVSIGKLYTYRRLGFTKGEVGIHLGFWFKDDFERQYDISVADFLTLYEIVIIGSVPSSPQ